MLPLGTVAIRLVVALVLGALVGFERERGERAAGIRTLALVSLGSALIIIVSAFGFADILGTPNVVLDPSRVAAQVVSGIGFLGAGTILFRKQIVQGLTTAAAIWLVAAVGLACGAGLIWEALITTALALLVLAGLRPIERRIFPRKRSHMVRLRVESDEAVGQVMREVHAICVERGIAIDAIELRPNREGQVVQLRCRSRDSAILVQALSAMQELPDVAGLRADIRGEQVQDARNAGAQEAHPASPA
ncbi:MAG TPA: MgtC/SapB family protein [Ktedonobacterales bacterium]|nr:MgtC/SapB family protein [Ktedonobacterales bacterium]